MKTTIILWGLVAICCIACSQPSLEQTMFTKEELVIQDQVLTVIDSVLSQYQAPWSDDKNLAYRRFISENYDSMVESGIGTVFITNQNRIALLESMDREALQAYFHIGDSVPISYEVWRSPRKWDPYALNFNVEGKYMQFLRVVGKTDLYLRGMPYFVEGAGGLCPSIYAHVINPLHLPHLDMENSRHRVFVALVFLGAPR